MASFPGSHDSAANTTLLDWTTLVGGRHCIYVFEVEGTNGNLWPFQVRVLNWGET